MPLPWLATIRYSVQRRPITSDAPTRVNCGCPSAISWSSRKPREGSWVNSLAGG